MDRLSRAIQIAVVAHAGVLDKGGEPYIFHPIRVMQDFKDEHSRIVAIMHDVVEDTDITLAYIRAEFGDEVADDIDALSRREGESYPDFIRRLAQRRKAVKIKLRDIFDNRRPERFQPGLTGLQGRYIKAQNFLVEVLKDGDAEDIQFLYDKGYIMLDEYKSLLANLA